ncbi:hypothetical protein EIP86_005827 [Pleurotus ostreatoroseus]|nr:hypothetical protein EIP86_005827 [Pleurotus ostreatoroseus]
METPLTEVYDTVLENLKDMSNRFTRIFDQATRGVQIRRNYAVTINRLPEELLSLIFVFIGDSGRDKMHIAQTCSLWRKIALGHPFMWTSLDLGTIDNSYTASKIFRRGQDYPLRMRCHDWNNLRIRCLIFELSRLQELDMSWTSAVHNASANREAPVLKRLTISVPYNVNLWPCYIPPPFLSAYPRLEYLRLVDCRMPFTPTNFRGLKELSIESFAFFAPKMDDDEHITSVLRSCPDLEKLSLQGVNLHSEHSHPDSSIVHLPRLRSIQLTLRPSDILAILSGIAAPNLRQCMLKVDGVQLDAHHGPLITGFLPSLSLLTLTDTLVVDERTSTVCAFNTGAQMMFTFVATQRVPPVTQRTTLAAFASHYSMPLLQTVRLWALPPSDAILLLRSFCSIQTLELVYNVSHDTPVGSTSIVQKLLREAKDIDEPLICARLHTLTMERAYVSIQSVDDLWELAALWPSLRRLRLHRCQADLPMDELTQLLTSDLFTVEYFSSPLAHDSEMGLDVSTTSIL